MFYFWILFAIVMAIVEVSTINLVSIWFCFGAVGAALTAVATDQLMVQIAVFVIISTLLLMITKPLVKYFATKQKVPTNADRIIGKEGIVILDIDPIKNEGQVSVAGQIWSAKTEGNEMIVKDTIVTVTGIAGVKAIVKLKGEN